MKINEVTGKVRRVTGNSVEIEQEPGVTTTIDTRKNPNALNKDPRTGKVQHQNRNSAQNSPNKARQTIRPGDEVQSDED